MFDTTTQRSDDTLDLFATWFQSYGDLLTHLPFAPRFDATQQGIFSYGAFTGFASVSGTGVATFSAVMGTTTFLKVTVDTRDTQMWDSVELRYDAAGALTSRKTAKDDGMIQEDFYVQGARVAKRFNDDGNQQAWDQVTNYYDETGRVSKVTDYDNGIQREDFFDNGLRIRTVQKDFGDESQATWNLIEAEYDANGNLSERFTLYDDGSTRLEQFVDGVRATVTQTDADTSQKSWQTITATYTDTGALMEKSTLQDDGVMRLDSFEDGFRTQTYLLDTQDAYAWHATTRLFDDKGVIESVKTTSDTEDVTLMVYNEGIRDRRLEVDADDSEPWAARETAYRRAGPNTVETFVDASEILGDYSGYLETDFLM